MIKLIHIIFIFTSVASFIIRIGLSNFKSKLLENTVVKIAPHIIDTILLASGITLVIQGNWLAGDYDWILSKVLLLLVYIALGIMAMRCIGIKRWLALCGAIASYIGIFVIAITKHGFV